jgi:hypothetical protein
VTVHNIKDAEAFIAGGRGNKPYRKIQHNTWVVPTERGYGIKYWDTIIVEFLPNGRRVLSSGGYRTVMTKRRMATYCPGVWPGRIYKPIKAQPKGWVLSHPSDPRLPPKIQKCRACKAKGRTFYDCPGVYQDWSDPFPTPPGQGQFFPLPYVDHKPRPMPCKCEGGGTGKPHTIATECWRCRGAGQADYGSHPMPSPFVDGITIDRKGKVVAIMTPGVATVTTPEPTTGSGWYGASKAPTWDDEPDAEVPNSIGGKKIVSALSGAIPDANAEVHCPVPQPNPCFMSDDDTRSVLDMVIHLNDSHRWTREQVADWLDTLSLDLSFSAA